MIIRWPGVAKPDSDFDGVTSSLDVFPTVCAAAGIRTPGDLKLDGVDLTRFLTGDTDGSPHDTLFWSNGPNVAVRQGDWKLIRSYQYTWLFDLSNDLGEKHNLAEEYPDIVKRLNGVLKKWKTDMPKPAWPSKPRRTKVDIDGLTYEINI